MNSGSLENWTVLSVRRVGQDELLIGKMLALLDRGAARDVWDMAHLPEQASGRLSAERFRKLFVSLSITLDHSLSTYRRDRLERLVTDRVIREQVAPLLNVEIELRAADLIEKAWTVVGRFLDLSPEEKDYVEFANRGVLRMELLFPGDSQEAMRIAAHPAIQWKISNVKRHAAKSSRSEFGGRHRIRGTPYVIHKIGPANRPRHLKA